MAHQIQWLVERRVALIEVTLRLDDAEHVELTRITCREYLDHGSPPVHLIYQVSHLAYFPLNLRLLHTASAEITQHSALGWVVLVGFYQSLLRFAANMVARALLPDVRFVDTLAEARAFLLTVDTTLPLPV